MSAQYGGFHLSTISQHTWLQFLGFPSVWRLVYASLVLVGTQHTIYYVADTNQCHQSANSSH